MKVIIQRRLINVAHNNVYERQRRRITVAQVNKLNIKKTVNFATMAKVLS